MAETATETLEVAFEPLVFERGHSAADVAHGVVVMLAAGLDWLVASLAVAEVDPLYERHLVEEVEGAVHARPADALPGPLESGRDLVS